MIFYLCFLFFEVREIINNKKWTIEEVAQTIEKIDRYKLLSSSYKNTKTKLEIQCGLGHVFLMTYNDFVYQKNRCSICANKKRSEKMRKDSFEVVKIFESHGYKVVDISQYITCDSKLDLECPNGHDYAASLNNFRKTNGTRCLKCRGIIPKHALEVVKNEFIKRNLVPLFDSYKNNKELLPFKCQLHPEEIQFTRLANLQRGKGNCKKCHRLNGKVAFHH